MSTAPPARAAAAPRPWVSALAISSRSGCAAPSGADACEGASGMARTILQSRAAVHPCHVKAAVTAAGRATPAASQGRSVGAGAVGVLAGGQEAHRRRTLLGQLQVDPGRGQ